MAVAITAGSGTNIESFQRSGTDHRCVVELGGLPTFWALTGALVATASRLQLVLYNNNATALVAVKKVVMLYPSSAPVTGVFSGLWTQRIRVGPTVDPAGNTISIFSFDSADTLPSSITAHVAPTTTPSGGTTKDLHLFLPQPDEVKLSTLDAPTLFSGQSFGGVTLWDHQELGPNSKTITLRQDQSYEIVQDAVAGTLQALRLLVFFTAA